MKKEYISPLAEIIYINSGDLLFDEWNSIQPTGTITGDEGTIESIGYGGWGQSGDTQLSKENKNLWDED